MNNKQFMLIILWMSIVSGMIGYYIGGIALALSACVIIPAVFLLCGD